MPTAAAEERRPAVIVEETPPSADLTPGKRAVSLRKALTLGVVGAVLVGMIAAGSTTWVMRRQIHDLDQQLAGLTSTVTDLTHQVDTLGTDKAALTAQLSDLRARADTLSQDNAALRAQLGGPQPVTPDISFGTVLKDGSWFDYLGTGEFLLIVDVTARNPDPAKPADFSVYDFRLKGPDNTVYPLLEQSPVATQPRFAGGVENLPGGRIQISSQQLAPGETVKGSLVFYVPKPVSRFTLTYHGTTQQLIL